MFYLNYVGCKVSGWYSRTTREYYGFTLTMWDVKFCIMYLGI